MLRSIAAIGAGFLTVVLLSMGTDQLLHTLEVYPPWGRPILDARLFVLALSYRVVYTLLGGFITARLAPWASMRHVRVLGIIGLVAGSAGVLVALNRSELGPMSYPIAIALTAYPCTWIGGKLGSRGR